MRGREFLMKDAYSFDLDKEGASAPTAMMLAYMRTFQRMGLRAVPMRADTGPIGGNLSHEFIILAPTGESTVFYDAAFEELKLSHADYDPEKPEAGEASSTRSPASTPRRTRCTTRPPGPGAGRPPARGQGHRGRPHLLLRQKYSKAMGLSVTGPDGQPVTPQMGSYGIGVSRLRGASSRRAMTRPASSGRMRWRRSAPPSST
jgi:prolyl-tRNA synthetase